MGADMSPLSLYISRFLQVSLEIGRTTLLWRRITISIRYFPTKCATPVLHLTLYMLKVLCNETVPFMNVWSFLAYLQWAHSTEIIIKQNIEIITNNHKEKK